MKSKWYPRFALSFLGVLSGLTVCTDAQRRHPVRPVTGFDDVVFAISFSPDDRTLAIARGSGEPSQRYGRIELWDTETGALLHVIKGFDGPVRSVSFSPDGQTLVSGSSEYHSEKIQEKARSREGLVFGELKWWDVNTGELKHKLTMPGEGNSELRATYSPDGKQLAVAETFVQLDFLSSSSSINSPISIDPGLPVGLRSGPRPFFSADLKLLDAQTGELRRKLKAGSARAMFSADGELIATWNSHEVTLWNAQTGREEHKLKGFKGNPSTIAFSPDGQTIAVVSTRYDQESSRRFIKVIGRSEVSLFDVHSWKATLKLQNTGAVNSIAFEPSGRVLLIGGMIREQDRAIPAVKLWDLQTGKTANFPTGGEDFTEAVDSLVVARSGGLLAFRSGAATVQVLDTQTWKVKQALDATSVGNAVERPVGRFLLSVKRVLAVAFSSDGKTLSSENDQGEIKLWDPRTGEVKKQVANDEDDPSLVVVSADGQSFAEIGSEKLRLWDVAAITKRIVPLQGRSSVLAIALSPDGQTLAIATGNDVVLLKPTGEVMNTFALHQTVNRLVFSDNGRRLAGAEDDGTIEIWNVANASIARSLIAGSKITALRFAPNGLTLASASEDHTIALWNAQTGVLQQRLQKHEAKVNALAFSPDGELLASGGDDRTVIIWQTASGKSRRTLKGHDQTVTSLAFSPDGRLLASGSGNAAVVLWEVSTGKLSRVLR